jgi:hypothetical protein
MECSGEEFYFSGAVFFGINGVHCFGVVIGVGCYRVGCTVHYTMDTWNAIVVA